MMVHLEGPIVDSFYEMALITWNIALNPALPLLNRPASTTVPSHKRSSAGRVKIMSDILQEHSPTYPRYDPDIAAETRRIYASLTPRGIESRRDCVTRYLSSCIPNNYQVTYSC